MEKSKLYHIHSLDHIFTYTSNWSLYNKKVSGSAVVFLVLYVDDILMNGNDISTFQFGYPRISP